MLTLDVELEAGSVTDKPTTQYTNFEFNSYAVIDGKVFAASPDGLFELGAGDDDGVPITWTLAGNSGTLGTSGFKSMRFGSFVGNFYGDFSVVTDVDTGNATTTYSVAAGKASGLQQLRFPLSRKERGTYWRFKLTGTADFSLDSFSILPNAAARGIHAY